MNVCFNCKAPMRMIGYLYEDGDNYGTKKLKCNKCGKIIELRESFVSRKRDGQDNQEMAGQH